MHHHLTALCLFLIAFPGCAQPLSTSTSGAGTFDYTADGFRFSYLHDESVQPRMLRGVLYPADYPYAGHVTTAGGYTFLAANHREVEFPPGKDFAVASRRGTLRFLDQSLTRFCPDIEDERRVRYGLKLELLRGSALWENEIEPWLRSE